MSDDQEPKTSERDLARCNRDGHVLLAVLAVLFLVVVWATAGCTKHSMQLEHQKGMEQKCWQDDEGCKFNE